MSAEDKSKIAQIDRGFDANRVGLLNARLKNNEHLYGDGGLAREIMMATNGQKVVCLDVDGVLRGAENGVFNPESTKLVAALKSKGYFVVIWTSAGRQNLNETPGIALLNVDLEITNNNYFLPPGEYQRSIEGTNYLLRVDEYSRSGVKHESRNFFGDIISKRQYKQPELIFSNVVLVDDYAPTYPKDIYASTVEKENDIEVTTLDRGGVFALLKTPTYLAEGEDLKFDTVLKMIDKAFEKNK